MRLLITDLDNTLYDWVTYFANSFRAMVKDLSASLSIDEERLLDEFKAVHQRYGNSEQPFAILELPAILERYGEASSTELLQHLQSPLNVFNSVRDKYLRLYPHVHETLLKLREHGIIIVGHTEAIGVNAYYRLRKLNIVDLFQGIYAPEGKIQPHPNPARSSEYNSLPELIRVVPKDERKPNPKLLFDICKREGISPSDSWYVGDSLTRDVSMAKAAGVTAVWARYGTKYDRKLWDILVRVTHWTDEDVKRESELSRKFQEVQPTYTIDDFSEILSLAGIREARLEEAGVAHDGN